MTKPLTDATVLALLDVMKGGGTVLLADSAVRLLDEVKRTRALLRRIEWGVLDDECPACGGPMEHRARCELAAIIYPSQ